MRILNKDNDKPIKDALVMLTPLEAKELVDKIHKLTSEQGNHLHINDENFIHEITFAIYTSENVHSFTRRVIDLIEKEI